MDIARGDTESRITSLSFRHLPVILYGSVFAERRKVLRDADQGINPMAIGDLRSDLAVRGRVLLLRG